jgi:glycosaminoglycan xylosylkinase
MSVDFKKAQNSPRGTQLKLVLQMSTNQLVLFKPRWYSREKIVTGPVYSGKDRHTSEIVSFYLGAMLNLRWTPIAVGRKISLKEVYTKGNLELQNTMLIKDNGSTYCVYGKCFYCKLTETVCGEADHYIEGVILYLVPGPISKHRSPWQRTYKDNVKATWEQDDQYCE